MTGDIDGDGKPLLVGVERNASMDRTHVNAIRSVYDLDNPGPWLQDQIYSQDGQPGVGADGAAEGVFPGHHRGWMMRGGC